MDKKAKLKTGVMRSCPVLVAVLCGMLLWIGACGKSTEENQDGIINLDTYLYPKDGVFSMKQLEEMRHDCYAVSNDFFYYILGLDTNKISEPTYIERIAYFSNRHRIIRDTLIALHQDWSAEISLLYEMNNRYKKLVNPQFQLPPIYSYTAPIDAPAVAFFSSWVGVNLTLFAGSDFPLYKTYEFQSIFPAYLQHRLDKRYFPFFVFTQILLDQYPLVERTHSLMEKMINAGKYLYIMQQLSPDENDDRITMFTPAQLEWCMENESKIFSHIKTTVRDLYTTAPDIISTYIGEAPKTQGMPDDSPGNLGAWLGWRIVNSFMNNNNITIQDLLKTNPYQVFQQSGYNPQ